ncbi:MAG: U3 small nucleolar RNA-associated protein 13 [Chrysothrix sp. TS-e1954]|nr:MAG: U3 small nucleolar RNA-associated protein 13 [Chrysothrix sp. TS-e1954]
MARRNTTTTTYEPVHVIEPFYTGGDAAISQDGKLLATCLAEDVILTDPGNGRRLARVEGDGEALTTLCLTSSATHLITCSRSLYMRIYELELDAEKTIVTATVSRSLKPHTSPVITVASDKTGTLLASGAADGTIKVWDIRGGFASHTFHGHSGVVSALHFFTLDGNTSSYRLASGSEDGRIRVWNLQTRKVAASLDSHVSVIRGLDYDPVSNLLLSASRDRTVMLWHGSSWKLKSTIPILETVETAGFLTTDLAYTGGETGQLRLWNLRTAQEATHEHGEEESEIVQALCHAQMPYVVTIHADQTLLFHSTSALQNDGQSDIAMPVTRRLSGTHDEIIDMVPIGGMLHPSVVLATNTEDVKVISLEMETTPERENFFGADVGVLKGHEDIVICLDVDWSGHWVVTGAKDNTARLWKVDPAHGFYDCYATFTGHAESLSAVALPRSIPQKESRGATEPLQNPPAFLITGSQDKTIKRWQIPTCDNHTQSPRATYTRKAHDKDINALDVNHSSALFASASQDRTVKIWSLEDGEAVGVLRGHKRGIWSAKFAPVDTPAITSETGQVNGARGLMLTGSGDKSVKIWSLVDYSCLRTFEGHTNSVLKVLWLPQRQSGLSETASLANKQESTCVASAAGDGLVKIWDAPSGELAATLDNHTDRVWALAISPKTSDVISGGGDGVLTFWSDTSSATAAVAAEENNMRVEQDQALQNHIRAGSYREAITLALALNHPGRLLSLFVAVTSKWPPEKDSLCGVKAVDEVLRSLDDSQILTLLTRIRDWNTNAKTAPVAQKILWTLLRVYRPKRLSSLAKLRGRGIDFQSETATLGSMKHAKEQAGIKDILVATRAYTERHYTRMEDLIDESYLIEYTLKEMDETGIGASLNGTPLPLPTANGVAS